MKGGFKMKKYILILAICLILITACERDGEAPVGKSPYVGGSKGLIAEFEPIGNEEAGVYAVYQDESFPIQILFKNKGEYDVSSQQMNVQLKGILISDFSGIKAGALKNTEDIEGISEINTEGGDTTIDFGGAIRYLPELAGSVWDASIFAEYVYRYKTFVSVPKVCFKEDFRDEGVCEVDETKKSFSSGAPVQVKSVTERPAGSGLISLEFEVENVGGGEVTIPGTDFPLRYGKVAYKITPESEVSKWTCTSAGDPGQLRLTDGKGSIRCKLSQTLDEGDKYTKQIGLELSYDYKDFLSETVRIKKEV